MNILIIGGQFNNKGAYLMILTVVKELQKRVDNATIVMSNYLPLPSALQKLNIKLLKTPLLHVGYSHSHYKRNLKFGSIVNLYKSYPKGEVSLKDIDIIVDIAGFAYGDLWGITPLKNLNFLLDYASKNNIKYIALPQAFGPFEKPGLKEEMKSIISKANLIFARDKISKVYLNEIYGDNQNIKLAPDITLSFESEDIEKIEEKYCCVVPNERMLDKGDKAWKQNYVPLLVELINEVLAKEIKVKILVHDTTSGDAIIAEEVKNEKCEIVVIDEPTKIKKLIANSYFLIGSRFHSLASALSCNVPSIGIGWSHKYQMLFEEYGMEDYVFEKFDQKQILNLLSELVKDYVNLNIRSLLMKNNEVIRKRNEEMWSELILCF